MGRGRFFKLSRDLALIMWSKAHVALRLRASYTKQGTESVCCLVWCPSGDMYFICHVTLKNHPNEVSCKSVGGSSSWYINSLIRSMNIVILIVKRKNVSSKTWILLLKTWVNWIKNRWGKNVTTSNMNIQECRKLKNILLFHLMTTFYNFVFNPLFPMHLSSTPWKHQMLKKNNSKCRKYTVKN